MQAIWKIDGFKFLNFGVHVENSHGVIDWIDREVAVRHTWPDTPGEDIDLTSIMTRSRQITLDCILVADSAAAALSAMISFQSKFDAAGFHQLTVILEGNTTTALSFLVYREDKVIVTKNWKDGKNRWRFSLKLIEPVVHKRLHLVPGATLTLTANVTADKECYVGHDGGAVVKVDPNEEAQAISKTFAANGVNHRCLGVWYMHPDDVTINSMTGTHLWTL